jgi:hypothetical protein
LAEAGKRTTEPHNLDFGLLVAETLNADNALMRLLNERVAADELEARQAAVAASEGMLG